MTMSAPSKFGASVGVSSAARIGAVLKIVRSNESLNSSSSGMTWGLRSSSPDWLVTGPRGMMVSVGCLVFWRGFLPVHLPAQNVGQADPSIEIEELGDVTAAQNPHRRAAPVRRRRPS